MKKTLLMAAAALAAGVISVQAQVYSQNIVGYANVPTPGASQNYLISVPFKIGVSNGANEVFPNLPNGSQVLLWDTANFVYTTYVKDTEAAPGSQWTDAYSVEVPAPLLPVGMGFFLVPSVSDVTNSFAGAIAINVGTSNVMSLPGASQNYLVGAAVPYSGSVTNGNNSGGGLNLNSIPAGSSILIWDANTFSYTTYVYDPEAAPTTKWTDAYSAEVAPPALAVGQGIFIVPSVGGTWTTGL